MATCPVKSLPEWRSLVMSVGENRAYDLWDKYDGNVPESESRSNVVKYALKSVDILQSDKSKQLFNVITKNKITGDAFWKKLQVDLAIPKDQIEMLKSFNTTDREQLITNMLANYSYVVEINTTQKEEIEDRHANTLEEENIGPYEDKGKYYIMNDEGGRDELSKELYNQYLEDIKKKVTRPTSYYSKMTSPGGTNYTENEISTPVITPAIKGHPRFATDYGIGWFRSDEKAEEVIDPETGDVYNGKVNKTRRVLEIQSDLYQKGRGEKYLIGNMENSVEELGPYTPKEMLNDNAFLQLLNRDNNWVTFFVKSIIQDSSKKGYEKVLFPTGETAAKIEGHQTLIEEINKIDKDINNYGSIKETTEDWNYAEKNNGNFLTLDETLKQREDGIKKLEQRKSELKSQGIEKLKPIEAFYEKTITNILNKQGYSPKEITDEYGNKWNEINIIPERESKTILLQKEDLPASKSSPETISLMKQVASKMGIDIQRLSDYVKGNPNVETKGINGLADGIKGIIAIAEGKEGVALTEEVVHIARAMLEQTNPNMVTEMISKIDRFGIYKRTLESYKDNKNYQLENGKPDIRKIKGEAVDKLISELIVNQNEGDTQFPELMLEANRSVIRNWWNKILDFIKGMYRKANVDVFNDAAKKITEEEIGNINSINQNQIYYQTNTNNEVSGIPQLKNSVVDKMYNTVIDMDSRLYLHLIDNANDKRHYTFDGQKVAKTVTEKGKENQHIPERNAIQKANDESMRYWGSDGGHEFQKQDITTNLIDEDGYARKFFLDEKIDSPLDISIVEKLKDFNRELIRSYPEGTRFIIERKVINTKEKGMLASTVDFKALVPITKEDGTEDMKIDNFDWKFISVNKDKYDDIHWKKQESWKSQMGEYTKIDILYGAKPNQLRKSRMIPFVLNYEYDIKGDNKSGLRPTSIEIGKLDTTGETNLYLLPVSIDTESTGNFERDELLKSLDVYYDKLARRKVSPNDKDDKATALKELAKAIRLLRMRGDYAPLSNIGKTFLQNASRAFKAFENIDYSTLTKEDIYNKTGELLEFKASAEKFASLDETFLSDFPKGDLNEYGKKILTSLESISSSTERMMKKIIELQREYVVFLASKEGMDREEILSPEKEVKGILKNLTEASKLPIRIVKLLTKMLLVQRKEVNIQMGRLTKEFSDLLIPLEKFAKSKGKSAFDLIGRADDGKLSIIKKIDPLFWEEFSKETLAENKEFLLKNINLEAYKTLAKERIEKRIEDIEHKTFSSEEEENIRMRDFAISAAKNELDIESKDFNGYTSHSFSYLFHRTMKTELHYSNDYQELLKSKEAHKMWEFLTSLNDRGIQAGYLNHNDTSFFALIEASMLQKLSASSDLIKESGDLFKDLYTVRINEESEFSILDKETGKPRRETPKLFTRTDKEVHQLSRDLTKVGTLWIKTLLEYEARINMENTANTMLAVERAKGHQMVDSKNNLIRENGVVKIDKNSNTNADIFQTIIDDDIYGLREDLSSIGNLSISSVAEKFSKTEEQAQHKVTSAKKAMENANMLTQVLAVGGKLAIAAPNYFGNHFQSFINNKGFYTYPEFFKNHLKLIISNLTTVQKGILDIIIPLNGDPSMELRRKLAGKQGFIKWLGTWTMTEAMMSTNYLPERNLQYTNALCFIDNAIVIDGKILNIRQYLRQKEHSRYTEMNQQERRTFEKSLDKRVDELKEKSLAKIARIENDQVVIPGVSDEELARFTTQIVDWGRNLNGQMSQEDKAGYRRDIMLKSLSMFRNWIVRQVTVRGHDISKNMQTGEWEYGRTRLFFKAWSHLGFTNIFKMRQIILGTDKGLAIMDEMLEQKRDAYYKKTGFHLKITNEEFYDTMRQALSNEMKELGMLFGLLAVVIGAKLLAPDKDEDPLTKNKYKYFARIINKISNEVDFYYNPISFVSMTKGNFLPALGLLVKAENAMTSLGTEVYGYATGNEELMKKSYPTKQFLDMIPGASQFEREWLPLIAPDLAKEMGIVVTVQPRIQQ